MPEYVPLFALMLLAPVASIYLVAPLYVRSKQKLAAHPDLQELEMQALDGDVAEYLMLQTRELFALGFDEPTLVQIPAPAPNLSVYLILLVNRPTGDKAVVTAVVGQGAAESVRNLFLAFSTRFDDGRVVETLNADELSAFPRQATVVRTQTPSITEARTLYDMHRFVLRQIEVRARPQLFEPGRAVDYLTENVFQKEYEELARRGWLVKSAGRDYYQPTVKGAYLMTWGLLPPMKWIRLAGMRHRENRILAEYRREQSNTLVGR